MYDPIADTPRSPDDVGLLELAGVLGSAVEVRIGDSEDLLGDVLQDFGSGAVDIAYMDHSNVVMLEDLRALERLGLLRRDALVVAVQLLKPGAPLYLWHALRSPCWRTRVVSLPDPSLTSP